MTLAVKVALNPNTTKPPHLFSTLPKTNIIFESHLFCHLQTVSITTSLKFVVQKGEPFPRRQILESSKLREFADDNFRFDENVRKVSEPVKNTAGKE